MKFAGKVIFTLLTLVFVFGAEAADEWAQMYGPDIPPPVPATYAYVPVEAVVPIVVPAAAPVWIAVPGSALSSCDDYDWYDCDDAPGARQSVPIRPSSETRQRYEAPPTAPSWNSYPRADVAGINDRRYP